MKKILLSIIVFCILLCFISPTVISTQFAEKNNDNIKTNEDNSYQYEIEIITPAEGNLYALGAQFFSLPFGWTIIVGPITVRAEVTGEDDFTVRFLINDVFQVNDTNSPYEYPWWATGFGKHTIKVELYSEGILRDTDSIDVFKIL